MDIENNLVNLNGSTYDDIDLNMIHTYNGLAYKAVREQQFWNEN